jgi:hypothetical protein
MNHHVGAAATRQIPGGADSTGGLWWGSASDHKSGGRSFGTLPSAPQLERGPQGSFDYLRRAGGGQRLRVRIRWPHHENR